MRRLTVLAASIAALLVSVGAASPTPHTQAATQGRWVIRDLGTINNDYSYAVAINEHGQIACNSWLGDRSEASLDAIPYMIESGYTAFLWQNGKRSKLTLGRPGSRIVAMNERGQVVGGAAVKAKGGGTVSHAFLWQKGKMTDLGTLGGPSSVAYAITERGQVVGWADTTSMAKNYRGDWEPAHHAFLWQKGNMTDLGTLGGSESKPVAINERGQVVGWADTRATGAYGPISRAFLWENGEMRDLGTLGGEESYAAAINDRGQVVGRADTKKDDPLSDHAFLWQ